MRRFRSALMVVCAALAAATPAARAAADDEPRETGLVERAATELAQIDVTVSGPVDVVTRLTADDFKLKVQLTKIQDFEVDRLCGHPSDADSEEVRRVPPPVSYLFYFEQAHLTLQGRARAMDIARVLIPQLIRDGSRAMVVSNAAQFKIVQEWTTDPALLVEAVRRLEADRSQWQFFANEEQTHVDRVVRRLNLDETISGAVALARFFQREELWRTDKSLRRLAMSLVMLAEAGPPKAVVYFADTLRDNPGEHYLSFFGVEALLGGESWVLAADHLLAKHPFDQAINEAVSQGIRFYPVLAEGLLNPQDSMVASGEAIGRTGTIDSSSRVRLRDAQDTLANLAKETGGYSFIRGDRPAKIVNRIRSDFSCLYLISFDPAGFARDSPLRIVVKTTRDDITIHSRGRVVFQSDEERTSTRLLNAFLLAAAGKGISGLQTNLVPTSYDDGSYSALLQVSIPGTMLASATWDLGASMVEREQVREEISGRLAVGRTGVPVVLEQEVRLKPGRYEIVAVARETSSELVLSDRREVAWPDPNGQAATCGPIAVLQPTAGAFMRDGEARQSGSLALSTAAPLDSTLPTALMGLVCRGRRERGDFLVERTLVGESRTVFPPLEFELRGDRCVQVRDLIPAGVLGPGAYRYEVRVLRGDAELHEVSRTFSVATR